MKKLSKAKLYIVDKPEKHTSYIFWSKDKLSWVCVRTGEVHLSVSILTDKDLMELIEDAKHNT